MSKFARKNNNGVLVCGGCAVVVNEKAGDTASTDMFAKIMKRLFA